ncbi:MAG: KilA-N domain-containing protein [Methylococcaceae bacterium]
MTTKSKIVTINYKDTMPVLFQSKDAWINATAIAKQFGKKPETYLKTERTQEYIAALLKSMFNIEESVALKSATKQNQIVRIVQGGKPEYQGTWIHPKLAIDFARWLSADFAVWCDLQVEKILTSDQSRPFDIQEKRDAHSPMMDALIFAREAVGKETTEHHFSNENLFCNRALTSKWEALDESDLDVYDLRLLKAIRNHNMVLMQYNLKQSERQNALDKYVTAYRAKKPRLKLVSSKS